MTAIPVYAKVGQGKRTPRLTAIPENAKASHRKLIKKTSRIKLLYLSPYIF